jgi:opacity protein-like surface antigen
MKKIFVLLLLVFPLSFLSINAQGKYGSFKVGFFSPGATSIGFIIGYEGGKNIDEIFSYGYSADWFHKTYVDENLVTDFNNFYGPNSTLNELRAKTNLHAIPVMVSVTGGWYVAERTRAFITGGAGIEMLLVYYQNYDNPNNDEFKAAFDFAWRLGGGVSYELGERSDGFLEIDYHYSKPSWQFTVQDPQTSRTQTFERVFDMSGIMMRVGVRFYF